MSGAELGHPGEVAGRTMIITGASSGIGEVAATTLAGLGAEIAVVGRNPERTRAVAAKIGATAFVADYARLSEVRRLAAELLSAFPRIHVLANNAGGIVPRREFTADRNERTFQENHLGAFLLTSLLLPRLIDTAETAPAGSVRVLQTASSANLFGRIRLEDLDNQRGLWLSGWRAYGTAKLENIVFTRELVRRLEGSDVSAYSWHPGLVTTRFGRDSPGMNALKALSFGRYGISAEQGAEPLIRLASTPSIGAPSGTFFARLHADGNASPQASDENLARQLWAASELRVARAA